ncbi:hypothetical protein IY230_01210 [Acholeplasma laidlawii]|uniref:hypothetical protein n=1 Tax=Acholeplasma laidlawii TaxID=2148 RepID=UPI0018C2E6A8|nr:hypothetical protein [Acholeplasma laidlawii]MBG0762228.1 hypothetical protein [Acholeplasma laidlawii]
MKKGFFVILLLIMAVALTACGPSESKFYFASQTPTDNSSWVYWVVIEKKGDKVVGAEWNAFNIEGDANNTYKGMDKVAASKAGIYNMNSDLWWHEQAELVIDKFIESNGDVNDRIPAPAGVSITTGDFYTLAELALASDPVEKGNYKDGYHFFSTKASATDRAAVNFWDPVAEEIITAPVFKYYTFGSFVVVNGRIVLAYYDSAFGQYRLDLDSENKVKTHVVEIEGKETTLKVIAPYTSDAPTLYKTKNQLGLSYAMKRPNGPGAFEYFEAAKSAGDFLIENQKLPETDGDGNFKEVDGVTGVTITASDFVTLSKLIPTK